MKNTTELIAHAETFIGAPFEELGRTRTGIDCLGLVLALYAFAGIELPDPLTAARDVTLQHRLMDYFAPVNPDDPRRDLDVFDNGDHHVGLIIGRHMLHTSHRTGAILHRIAGVRLLNLYRYKGAPC
jgi:cell wall-associated NlpC family hydrolase